MIIVLQNCKSLAYLNANAEWTDDLRTALTFGSSNEAIRFALQNNVSSAQVVLKFRDKNYDFALPISDDCKDKDKAA